jgi:hypothetical protein
MGRNNSSDKRIEKQSENRVRWSWYRILLVVVPTLIPVVYFYLIGNNNWSLKDLGMVGLIFAVYWLMVFVIAARVIRHNQMSRALSLASPLIEVPLSTELRDKLSSFAATKQQKLAVAAFELLDQEIPRFEQEEERDRARRDNEHLRQQVGQGAFLVAVTTEILKRLLLLSGAQEEDRKVWRSHISKTAARIVSDAIDHRSSLSEQPS